MASIISTFLLASNAKENIVLNALIFISGIAIFTYAIYLSDERLKRRGKGASWLLIFFGPIAIAIMFSGLLEENNDKLIMIYLIMSAIITLPTAIWGICELSATPKDKDENI